MPPPTEETVMSKAKTALVYLSIAGAVLLLSHTVKHSSTIILWIAAIIIIVVLFFHSRHNPDRTPHAPLFSFPSFSLQQRYEPLAENNFDLPEPAFDLPTGVTQHLEPDTLYDRGSTDGVVTERGEPSERISTVYGEEEISNLADDQANDDQGGDETLDQTWKSILARGKAKPIRSSSSITYFEGSNQRRDNLMPEMRRSATEKRRERKKVTEGSSYDSLERKAEGWRKRDAIGISSDELTRLSEMFIMKQRNDLRIERQESDQQRLVERLRINNYRNAVTAV